MKFRALNLAIQNGPRPQGVGGGGMMAQAQPANDLDCEGFVSNAVFESFHFNLT